MRVLIDILLPTCNGQRFIDEMLASVQRQTVADWRLLIRDDGSDDATREHLAAFARVDSRASVAEGEHVGVIAGMDALLRASTAPYFMPADQDDIWRPDKIAVLLEAMRGLEERHGPERPLLVYSDAELIDSAGASLGTTFCRVLGVPDDWEKEIRSLLVMSPAPGCTMLGNAALRRAALPLPEANAIYMHDWWLLLCAATLGAIACVPAALVCYRQHSANALGARRRWPRTSFAARLAASRAAVRRTQRQAETLLKRHGAAMPRAYRNLCAAWAAMPALGRIERIRRTVKFGFAKPGALRRVVFYAVL